MAAFSYTLASFLLLVGTVAFQQGRVRPHSLVALKRQYSIPSRSYDHCLGIVLSSVSGSTESELESSANGVSPCASTDELNARVSELCTAGKIDDAIALVRSVEQALAENRSDYEIPDQSTYVIIINAFANDQGRDLAQQAEDLLHHMALLSKDHPSCAPKGPAYSAVVLAWSKSNQPDAAEKAEALLEELWSLYNSTGDKLCLPTRATYTSAISAWARSGKKKRAAERAEALLEEMETYRSRFPQLGPTTPCVNAVLNAWSKSLDPNAADRCEEILKRMEGLSLKGRKELEPDTISFNTVIDTLAQSGQRGAERRAEILLQRMDDLSKGTEFVKFPCEPDTFSFNIVINSWAKSREPAAARRAEAILRHMERRNEAQSSCVEPDSSTYNNVIHAWSRSNEEEAPKRADEVLKRMERAYEKGNVRARPDAATYNSMINVWAKSRHPLAGDRSVQILTLMKKLRDQEGRLDCAPDVFTYTSVIDALAKRESPQSVDKSVTLLAEMEEEYQRTRSAHLKPNVRTYTSVINAIAKSRQGPDRAEAILDRLEALVQSGDTDLQPDAVSYNAVINAWGWSNEKGKSLRAGKLYQRMLDMYKSGKNKNVKPDIITCNSLLNACAFEVADDDSERAATMQIAVATLEDFQSKAPTYGWPNHITYGNMLLAISRLMPMSDKRLDLAEATFWQCCKAGHVSALVITHLRNALNEERLKSLMGSALFVNNEKTFSYDMQRLPRDWRRYAPQPKDRMYSSRLGSKRAVKKPSSTSPR